MIGMQYRINLPSDYDMQIIKDRVKNNGNKTDGFNGLLFKCYLIQEKDVDGFENVYSPLYIWNDSNGMNQFLFGGFYDNIIKSFGWQKVNIGVPILMDLKEEFNNSKYVLEISNEIAPNISLTSFEESIKKSPKEYEGYVGRVCVYNPDKWKYSMFYFYLDRPEIPCDDVYQILHISRG